MAGRALEGKSCSPPAPAAEGEAEEEAANGTDEVAGAEANSR